jgi:hypothetical protein
LAILFMAATSACGSRPAARPSAVGARLSDAISIARRRSRFRNDSPSASRVRAPPRAASTSTRAIAVQPSSGRSCLRTAIATKIFVVEAIGRISSAALPWISRPVSASSTTMAFDWISGRSSAKAGPASTPRAKITAKARNRIILTRGPSVRDFLGSCAVR